MKLVDKVAVVTGSGVGMGRAIAIMLAQEGASVMVTDMKEDWAVRTAAEIKEMGYKCMPKKLDVRSVKEIEEVVRAAVDEFGSINILVNNAGVSTIARAIDLTEEEWDYNFDVNAKGVFLCCQAVAKQMIKQGSGGKIVNIASVAGKRGSPLLAHYAASKFAVIGWTQSLAIELAPYHINVNAVCPGIIKTSMIEREAEWKAKLLGVSKEEVMSDNLKPIRLGRLGVPEDVAKAVVFLCSEASDYITGQSLNVCGGLVMH
jgi:meso-butanediol dehydrogenase/(S,S)-butanediol dehydrogenase/diacetyl reductase